MKKLNKHYRGSVFLKEGNDTFINLSKHSVKQGEIEGLYLDLNCRLQTKVDPLNKKMEIEVLY